MASKSGFCFTRRQEKARQCFWQLLQALRVLQENNIVHHDVKLENIMLQETQGDLAVIKLVDFGLSHVVDFHGLHSWFAGTYQYMSPELVNRLSSSR